MAMAALTMRLTEIQAVGFSNLSILQQVHSATRALLASWGYRYDVWSLRRFAAPKRYSIVLAFLQAALAETLDAIIEMQDKLITKVHNNARERREEVLRAAEQARTRAKEGKLRGREFEDQLHSFSCLAILHNAVVAWNLKHIALLIEQLRAEGHIISDEDLALTSPLVRRHINPYGRYHFDLTSFKRVSLSEGPTEA